MSFNIFKQHLVQIKQLFFNLHRKQFNQNIALLSLIKISNLGTYNLFQKLNPLMLCRGTLFCWQLRKCIIFFFFLIFHMAMWHEIMYSFQEYLCHWSTHTSLETFNFYFLPWILINVKGKQWHLLFFNCGR